MMVPLHICLSAFLFFVASWYCTKYFSYAVDGILRDNGGRGTFFFGMSGLLTCSSTVFNFYPFLDGDDCKQVLIGFLVDVLTSGSGLYLRPSERRRSQQNI